MVAYPRIFLRAPLAPIYTNFEMGTRAEKAQFFWSKFSKKNKNSFFGLFFFEKLHAGEFLVLWESSEDQFG